MTDDTPPATTLSVVDTNRITEKAEALRRTYRSNLRPTLDSGYSTMATRSGDVQGVTRRRRRRRRSSDSCSSSMDYNSSTSSIEDGEGAISTTDTDTDTAGEEEDKEGVIFTQKEQQRASSTSTASSSTRPESLGGSGCQQHDMMGDDHLFLCVSSSDHEPYPRSSLSTPCYAESRRPLHTPSPTPDHHQQHHLESKSSDDLKEENNRSACSKESSMIAMKQDKDNTTTYFVSCRKWHVFLIVAYSLSHSNLAIALAKDNLVLSIGTCVGMCPSMYRFTYIPFYRALNVQTGEIVAIKRICIEDIQVDSEIMASRH